MLPIHIRSIQFHVDGVTPTFPLRRNAAADSLIEPPEWRDGSAVQGAVAFVKSLQRAGRNALAVVTLDRGGDVSEALTVTVKADALTRGSKALLGNVEAREVRFEPGASGTVFQFELAQMTITAIAVEQCAWEWAFAVPGEVLQTQNTGLFVYALLLEPSEPWGPEAPRRPWTDVLDVVCSRKWAGGARFLKALQNRITRRFYRMGEGPVPELVYEGTLAYFLTTPDGLDMYLNCADFLLELDDQLATSVNCRDASTVVTAFCNILGAKLVVKEITCPGKGNFLLGRSVKPIGGTPRPPSFVLHEIAVLGAEFRTEGGDSLVWDGSLRIDVVAGKVDVRRTPSSIGLRFYLEQLTPSHRALALVNKQRKIAVGEVDLGEPASAISPAGDSSPFLLGQVFDGFTLDGFIPFRYVQTFGGGTVSRWKSRDDKWGWLFVQTTVHKSFDAARFYMNQLRGQASEGHLDLEAPFQQGFETDEGRTLAFRRGNVTCRFSSYRAYQHSRVRPIATALDAALTGSGGELVRDANISNLSASLTAGGQPESALRLIAPSGNFVMEQNVLRYDGDPAALRVYRNRHTVV